MITQNRDLGEQLLSLVATQTIRNLFTKSDQVEVNIKCYPSNKILKGQIDSLTMTGRGLVIRKDFQVSQMIFQTDQITLDLWSIWNGKFRLTSPTTAIAQVTLTQSDLNQVFKTRLVQQRFKKTKFEQIKVNIEPNNQIQLTGIVKKANQISHISLTSTLKIKDQRWLHFDQPQYHPIPNSSESSTLEFITILNDLVDLHRFNLDGVNLFLNQLETKNQSLIFHGQGIIQRVPRQG